MGLTAAQTVRHLEVVVTDLLAEVVEVAEVTEALVVRQEVLEVAIEVLEVHHAHQVVLDHLEAVDLLLEVEDNKPTNLILY